MKMIEREKRFLLLLHKASNDNYDLSFLSISDGHDGQKTRTKSSVKKTQHLLRLYAKQQQCNRRKQKHSLI